MFVQALKFGGENTTSGHGSPSPKLSPSTISHPSSSSMISSRLSRTVPLERRAFEEREGLVRDAGFAVVACKSCMKSKGNDGGVGGGSVGVVS